MINKPKLNMLTVPRKSNQGTQNSSGNQKNLIQGHEKQICTTKNFK